MQLLRLFLLGCCMTACIISVSAIPRASALSDPEADPEPVVGSKVKKTCKEVMSDAKSEKVLCRNVADHVVEKVIKVCRKGVKYGCKLASFAVDFDKCYNKVTNLICPSNEQTVATFTLAPTTSVKSVSEQPLKDDVPQHPSWIGRLVMSKCDKYVKPLTNNITDVNHNETFDPKKFCKELGHSAKLSCIETFVGSCEGIPEDWTVVRSICEDFMVPFVCK